MIEKKLSKYNGYISGLVTKWKAQIALSDASIQRILEEIHIFSSREIRSLLRTIVDKKRNIFDKNDCYICKFGYVGKSGEILMYEFFHTFREYRRKIKELWKLPELPESSRVIFIDDLVGSGNQSVKYIKTRLNTLLNPSHKAYLLCLCATPQGIKNVKENTNISVLPALILKERDFQYFSECCKVFDDHAKHYLKELNEKLHSDAGGYGNLGLLLAFYFTVPNNTLPFIWKDGAEYENSDGVRKKWQALLPREY